MIPRGRQAPALLAWLLALATAARAVAADEIRVTARLEPDPIGREELATLTIVVESSAFGSPAVEPQFDPENLALAGGPYRSQSQSWVNGKTSSSTQLTWRLRPLANGLAALRAIRVEVEGKVHQLPDQTIRVVEAAPKERQSAPPREAVDPLRSPFFDDPFSRFDRRRGRPPAVVPKLRVRATVEPSTAFVGQQVVWRLLLETQTDVSRIDPRGLPDFHGFWVRDIAPDRSPKPVLVEIDSERYGRVAVLERALFPLQAGRFDLPGFEVALTAQLADAAWFGPLAGSETFVLRTEPLRLDVRPLPVSPPGFSGIVGPLQLAARLDSAQLALGQATTFTVRATSKGNLQALELPRVEMPTGLRSFPPTRSSEDRIVDGELESTVEWRYVVLADQGGTFRLPAVELDAFDPASQAFQRARSAELTLAVSGSAPLAPPSVPRTSDPYTANSPSALEGASATVGSLSLRSLALGGTAAAALSGLVLTFALWRRRRSGVEGALRVALGAAELDPSPRAAATAVEEAWHRFLAERWALPRSVPVAQWLPRLSAAGVGDRVARDLTTLFEELHLLAYAPELSDVEALRADLVARSRALLRRLR